jgi:hypothetical protein
MTADRTTGKLENIISGHGIGADDADWLRAAIQAPAEGDGPFPAPDLRGIDGATHSEWRMLGLPAKAILIQEKDLPKIIERACLSYAAGQPQPKGVAVPNGYALVPLEPTPLLASMIPGHTAEAAAATYRSLISTASLVGCSVVVKSWSCYREAHTEWSRCVEWCKSPRDCPANYEVTHREQPAAPSPAAAPAPQSEQGVKGLSEAEKERLARNWFAEDWAVESALGLLYDYDLACRRVKLEGGDRG